MTFWNLGDLKIKYNWKATSIFSKFTEREESVANQKFGENNLQVPWEEFAM